MAEGLEAVKSVMAFFTENTTFALLLSAAVAIPIISGVLGIFFRK